MQPTTLLTPFVPNLPRWILDRFIVGQMLYPVLAGVGGGTLLVTAGKLFPLAERLVVERIDPWTVAQLLLLDLPATVVLALPIGAMFATLLTLGSLASQSELTALRAAGVSWRRLFLPILLMGLCLSGVSFVFTNSVVPASRARIRVLDQRALITQFVPSQNQDIFFKADEHYWFFIRQVLPTLNKMQNVTVLVFEPLPQLRRVILAQEGTWNGAAWELYDGVAHRYGSQGLSEAEEPFEKMTLPIARDLATLMQPPVTPAELSLPALQARVRFLAQSNLPAREWLTEWYSRFSLPWACFFCVFLALPLGVQASRQVGRYGGVVAGIMLVFVYYLILNLARSLGNAGAVPPWVAAWSHSLVFGSTGLLLSWRFLVR